MIATVKYITIVLGPPLNGIIGLPDPRPPGMAIPSLWEPSPRGGIPPVSPLSC